MLLILHLSGCLHDTYVCQIKGASFFRPTSDVNISETVYPIYLKINDHFLPTLYVPLYHVYSTASHLTIRSQTMLTGIILYYLVT